MADLVQGASIVASTSPVLPTLVPQAVPTRGQPHVYLLPTQDRTRLKIGRSIDPVERIAELCRVYPDIDVARAVILAVDAKIVETILHDTFEPYRLRLAGRRDGYTEWFVGDFVDEVTDFCQHIAHHRQARYGVIRDVPALLQAHFSQRQAERAALPVPTKKAIPRVPPACLAELATYQARQFVQTLQEQVFDEIVIQNHAYFLVRTVRRNEEPECWRPTPWRQASDWGLKLLRSGMIHGRIDGAAFVTQLIQIPSFRQQNSEWGQEYYRLERGPDAIPEPKAHDPAVALDAAFAILWDALAHLPRRELPLPLSAPARAGFHRRPRRQAATAVAAVTVESVETGRA